MPTITPSSTSIFSAWGALGRPGMRIISPVITTKKLGPAITRTRARRLLRECFRLHQHDLRAPLEMVLVARRGMLGKKLTDVESDYLSALHSANLLKETA